MFKSSLDTAAGLATKELQNPNELGSISRSGAADYSQGEIEKALASARGAEKAGAEEIFSRFPKNLPLDLRLEMSAGLAARPELLVQTYRGETTLQHLLKINDPEIFTSTVKDLLDPGRINQGKYATCPVTTAQWNFCRRDPALYVSQIAEAVTTGRVTDLSGETVMHLKAIPLDTRDITSRLYQTMMMDAVGHYNPATDMVTSRLHPEIGPHTGLYSTELESLLEKVTGRAFQRFDNLDPRLEKAIERCVKTGDLGICAVKGLGTGAHELHDVNVVADREGYIYFRNPWGRFQQKDGQGGAELMEPKAESIYRLPREEFLRRCEYMVSEGGQRGVTPGAKDLDAPEGAVFFTISRSDYIQLKKSTEPYASLVAAAHKFEKAIDSAQTAEKREEQRAGEEYNAHWARARAEILNVNRKKTEE